MLCEKQVGEKKQQNQKEEKEKKKKKKATELPDFGFQNGVVATWAKQCRFELINCNS